MEQRKLKVGIIGCGRIAGAHAISYNKMDDVEVVGLADIIPGKAKAFAEQWGLQSARLYDNHLDLLENEELDGVSICTYNMQHAVCAIDALNRGINVVIEKPMCVTMEEAYAMVRAEMVWSMRQAYFAPGEVLKVEQAKNRICRKPTATCPPAIPVVVPGERIDEAAIQRFLYYGIDRVEVVQEA